MVIQHNIAALNSHRNLGINNANTSKNLEKLSSGYRINRAGDDAAGLAISEKMRGQIRGLAMAEQNTSNGISLIQTAEGGLNETHAILQRMRELAVQSSNGTFQNEDRDQIALEVDALKEEIDRISTSTHYNQIRLLNGNLSPDGEATTPVSASEAFVTEIKVTGGARTGNTGTDILATDTMDLEIDFSGTTATGSITIGGTTYELASTTTAGKATAQWAAGAAAGTPGKLTITLNVATDDIGQGKIEIEIDSKALEAKDPGVAKLQIKGAFGVASAGVDDSGGNATAGTNDTALDTNLTYMTTGVGKELTFQIGANGGADQKVGLKVNNMGSKYIGTMDPATPGETVPGQSINDINVKTQEDANKAIKVIDDATNYVSSQRAQLGALQNRLEHTMNNLGVTKENLTAAESTIRDVDMAKEMMEFTKNNILVQASQAMLAQANSLPQGVLSLLR